MSTGNRHRPRKRFGQHFLAPAWALKVVAAIDPQPGDLFLEIGPGTGALTLPLAATGAAILAVEVDRDLSRDLAERAPAGVTVMTGDALQLDVIPFLTGLEPQRPALTGAAARPSRYRVVGNLPYNLSTPIFFRLIDWYRQHRLFFDATLMVQREVGDRLASHAGTREYGVLGISVQIHARVTKLLDLPPGAFKPAPKVRSSLVRLIFGPPAVTLPDETLFDALIRGLFSQRRKTLLNAIRRFGAGIGAQALAASGLDGRRRPDTLDLGELARLTAAVAVARRPSVL
jgi:16S rRNA (adenine1518-N6/adenine1519-N6)-dimethyltransferase